ncbi:SDR family oxidoreductase [Photobacterium toruni]|uniref:2-dehydro-3-deoxy-D-gluconate 5-dehydrogenase n=1 Tax=Photobacterium toruni TaxID=1935446 RepID=A0A1T4L068_9GAMM|nr:SDR family oxidoreductase [Photobacterium toruni]MEC6814098.1 SDR family oxidoreductase [Photobacterium toruni]MEC6833708.1 SDR family oxidoreductase [Photobacterium toruni]SJZ48001.1 2-dehydro-3-deoxy-D-gluconate 5-dehydrogenase [Photobacterium toruni]
MHIGQSVAIITEAGNPISKAVALHFASLGATLALVDNNEVELKKTLQSCQKVNDSSAAFYIKSYDETSIQALFQQVNERFGSINILLNTWTGTEIPNLLSPTSIVDFNDVMQNIATSFFIFGKVAAEFMQYHPNKSVIVNLALSHENHHPYTSTTSKTVVSGLTQNWANELANLNIRVGGIVPINLQDKPYDQHTIINVPMQDEIARNVEYIVRNDSFSGRMIESEIGV